jgi:hypothetical protein
MVPASPPIADDVADEFFDDVAGDVADDVANGAIAHAPAATWANPTTIVSNLYTHLHCGADGADSVGGAQILFTDVTLV